MFHSFRVAFWHAVRPPSIEAVLESEVYGAERDLLDALNVAESAQAQVDYRRGRLTRLLSMKQAAAEGRPITDALPATRSDRPELATSAPVRALRNGHV